MNGNPDSGIQQILAVESGILGIRIRNNVQIPRTKNPESSTWNPESNVLDSLTWGNWEIKLTDRVRQNASSSCVPVTGDCKLAAPVNFIRSISAGKLDPFRLEWRTRIRNQWLPLVYSWNGKGKGKSRSLNARDTEVFVLLLCRKYCEAWPVYLTETELSSLLLHVVGYINCLIFMVCWEKRKLQLITIDLSTFFFLTFDMDKLGKIRRPRW